MAHDLLAWYEVTPYEKPSDYVWATDANRAGAKRGKQPVWLSIVMRDYIQPAARKVGINQKRSWHTFRHTFSTLLKGNGEDVKVVQELLRHSCASTAHAASSVTLPNRSMKVRDRMKQRHCWAARIGSAMPRGWDPTMPSA